ncbi:murein hydrolase activator EnvC family protein [Dongia soli]|uniref:Peptidoglycan DD-metalloendopeptidase family protein n=1 Tax=Dongia soli TaxID=600628 RepID=A0ABU5E5M8_9PROT|nr:peptidoglycan DD-metalloendopeptidase family protein [Dongia soli]MDY0881513.1 peptidoglycan DD-metalloendopeptidase family protein [Dongia soli]
MRRRWLSAALLCGMAGILPCPGWAQSADDLQALQQKMQHGEEHAKELQEKAASLGNEISQLQAAMIKSAEAVQNAEEQASELEATLQTLTMEERDKDAALTKQQAQMTTTLVALERLSAQPAQAALFADRSAIDQARAARLLGLVVPQLDSRAAALKDELADLHDLHDQIIDRRDRLGQTLGQLAGENQRLAAMVEQKSRLQKSTLAESAAAQDRLKLLADQAESLKDLLDRLERAKQEEAAKAEKARQEAAQAEAARQEAAKKAARRPGNRNDNIPVPSSTVPSSAAPAGDMTESEQSAGTPGLTAAGKEANIKSARSARPFPPNGKGVMLPVRGSLAASFGAAVTEFGETKGIVLATRANAQVIAPFDGKVVFEGPFRSYGQILIIEHRGGYHTVLAGLGRVDAVVGQWLLAGEPVGVMGSSGIAATDQGTSGDAPGTSVQDHPKLYVELRHKGQPVDPAPWFGTLTRVDNSEGQ